MTPYWKELRAKLKVRYGVTHAAGNSGVPGCFFVDVCHADFQGPIGTVWYNFSGKRLNIINIFIDERLRRCGLATYLHQVLIHSYPQHTLRTDAGTKFGVPWMKALGYKQAADGYEFTKHLSTGKKRKKK